MFKKRTHIPWSPNTHCNPTISPLRYMKLSSPPYVRYVLTVKKQVCQVPVSRGEYIVHLLDMIFLLTSVQEVEVEVGPCLFFPCCPYSQGEVCWTLSVYASNMIRGYTLGSKAQALWRCATQTGTEKFSY